MSANLPTGAARRTPWEVVFGAAVFEDEHFPAIAAEAEARGTALADPGAFVMLATVGKLLRALRAPGDDGVASPDAVLRYGALAWQAFHFRVAGHPLYTLSDDVLDHLVHLEGIGSWQLAAPEPAGYVQLPRNRVWVPAEDGAAPEPVDGIFWTCPAGAGTGRLDLLVCTGVRPGRPGIGAIDLVAPLPAPPPGHWGDSHARDSGPDFTNVLPGGEYEGLYALTNAAEALKLVSRIFWYAVTRRGAIGEPVTAREGAAPESPHAMPPSTLPARPIRATWNGEATS